MTDYRLHRPPAAAREVGAPPLHTRPAFYGLLFSGNVLLIMAFWWATTGSRPAPTAADQLNAIGRVAALLGTYLVLWELVLLSRLPSLQIAIGTERLLALHRWNGALAVVLLLVHAILQTLAYQLAAGVDVLAQLVDFARTYDGMLTAMVAMALLLAVAGASLVIVRRRLAYQTWYFVHLYTYVAIALAFSHELADGADLIGSGLFTAYWIVLYVIVGATMAWGRVAQPLLRFAHHRFRVQRVEREAPNVVSIYVTGRDLQAFDVRAGQFLMWRFLDRRRWWEAHPFSISRPPDGRTLRLTVKGSGDFTARVFAIRPGTPVLVEGPFGAFTAARCTMPKALLVGGGIGITPVRAVAEDLRLRGVDVTLLHRCRSDRELVFARELQAQADAGGMRFWHLLNSGAPGGTGRNWFEPDVLGWLVPDVRERDVYVCGPRGMTRDVIRALRALAVPPAQVHTETFRMLP